MTHNGRRLRVLHIGKYFAPIRGGIESHLRDLCSELSESVDLKVIVANDSIRRARGSVDGVDVLRLPRMMTAGIRPDMPVDDRQHSPRPRRHRASASPEPGRCDRVPARTACRCTRHHLAQRHRAPTPARPSLSANRTIATQAMCRNRCDLTRLHCKLAGSQGACRPMPSDPVWNFRRRVRPRSR